jgi:hypothetical protein
MADPELLEARCDVAPGQGLDRPCVQRRPIPLQVALDLDVRPGPLPRLGAALELDLDQRAEGVGGLGLGLRAVVMRVFASFASATMRPGSLARPSLSGSPAAAPRVHFRRFPLT